MRRASRTRLVACTVGARGVVLALLSMVVACAGTDRRVTAGRSTAERAALRAYDGAPPTIPHDASIGACVTCHDADGSSIEGIGVAPASPHGHDAADGALKRCRQCHAPRTVMAVLVASRFAGLPQGPWKGSRATPGAPPRIPHALHMREECLSCHAGPGARAEVRTTHPERVRCRQCHVPETAPTP